MAGWDGLTIGDLFERVRISMPQNAPGSLSGQQNADILAFMFSSNKFPAGQTELPKEAGILKQIKFEVKKPYHRSSLQAIQKNGAPGRGRSISSSLVSSPP